jgi:hypothetical protein
VILNRAKLAAALTQLTAELQSDAKHGLKGRLARPAVVGNKLKTVQGPKCLPPRLNKVSI